MALDFFHNAHLKLTGFELSGIKISALRYRRHMYFLLANISRLFDLLSHKQTPLSSSFFVIRSADNTLAIWRVEYGDKLLGLSRDITSARVVLATKLGGCVDMDVMTNIFGSKADKKLRCIRGGMEFKAGQGLTSIVTCA